MGTIKKADSFLLKNYKMKFVWLILVILALSILIPVSAFIMYNGKLDQETNPTIVNGIITATSIVFGFAAYELRERKSSNTEKLLLSFPLLLFLMITVEQIFIAAITNKITAWIALVATSNFLFNILYVFPLIIVKQTHVELEEKRNSQGK